MNINEELAQISEQLKQERDEIKLKVHLASMEAKGEWEQAEATWAGLKDNLDDIVDETKETTEELLASAKIVADELGQTYERIKKRLTA